MAQLIIEVPDNQVTRILDAFAANPEFESLELTKKQYVERRIKAFVREVVGAHEAQIAAAAAIERVAIDLE